MEDELTNIFQSGDHSYIFSFLENNYIRFSPETKISSIYLYAASLYDDSYIAKLMITKYNAEIDVKDKDGTIPLFLAASKGYENIIKILLSHNADINNINDLNYSALCYACQNGNLKCIEILLKNNANMYITNIDFIIRSIFMYENLNKYKSLELLLKYGYDINYQSIDGLDTILTTIVYYTEEPYYIKLLLSYNPNLNLDDINRQTMLHHIILANNVNILRYFFN